MIHRVLIADASMHPPETQARTSNRKARTWQRGRGLVYGLVWLGLTPLAVGGAVVNIDFNGDRHVPGPNARPVTYQGQGAAGGGTYWNGLPADSRLPNGTDDDNLTVGGTTGKG